MWFEWKDHPESGYYYGVCCEGRTSNKEQLYSVSITDNTCKHKQEEFERNKMGCPVSFEVYFSNSKDEKWNYYHCFDDDKNWHCRHSFDYDEDWQNHFDEQGNRVYGFRGKASHTIEDIKKWCEVFMALLEHTSWEDLMIKLADETMEERYGIRF